MFPYLKGIENKEHITKFSVFAMLFVIQIEIVSMIGCITMFGIERNNELIFPKITQTQTVSYFGFMEAGELFVMLQIIAGWFMKLCITFYALLQLFDQIGVKNKFRIYIVAVATFVISFFASSNLLNLFDLLDYLLYIQLFNFVVMPLIGCVICLIKDKYGLGGHRNVFHISAPEQDSKPQSDDQSLSQENA
ncbi:MAG: hypothetical protein K0R90_1079 [Oscillospiraceae bacterium]|nr:hypothetical protein [Oscillospiraceae bacterium]